MRFQIISVESDVSNRWVNQFVAGFRTATAAADCIGHAEFPCYVWDTLAGREIARNY